MVSAFDHPNVQKTGASLVEYRRAGGNKESPQSSLQNENQMKNNARTRPSKNTRSRSSGERNNMGKNPPPSREEMEKILRGNHDPTQQHSREPSTMLHAIAEAEAAAEMLQKAKHDALVGIKNFEDQESLPSDQSLAEQEDENQKESVVPGDNSVCPLFVHVVIDIV